MLKPASKYYDYLIIACIVVISYWQVSFYQYTIKCDAALLSLPWKKFVSDSLRSGYFPIWNPYINLGWTQGMEPSSWYFPSWISALFGKYRLSYLHTEISLHLMLGAVGMYKLLSRLKLERWALISGSLVYILSGFFIGNFQHLGWTFYACWLPLVLYFFFEILNKPNWITSIKFGLTGAMLVLSSYIPFIMTTLIFMTITILVVFVKHFRNKSIKEGFRLLKFLLIAVGILFLICSPCFYMLFINLSTMYRGGRYNDQSAGFGSLVPMSWISFVFPFGTTAPSKWWGGTDISMNNAFIGIFSFLFIGLAFFAKEKRKLVWILSMIGIIALLFSFGKFFPPTWYIFRHLPFYEKLRFASQFRIYFIVSASILVAIGSNYLLKNGSKKGTTIFLLICTLVFLGIGINNNHGAFLKYFNAIIVQGKNTHGVWESAKFQSIIWAVFCLSLIIWNYIGRKYPEKNAKRVIGFNILFLFAAVQMNMFYTGVANERVSDINKKWLQLPTKFYPIQNQSYKDYWREGLGLTWTNTGGLNHVPNINCYHPYDSKNYGDYMNFHQEPLPLVYGGVVDYHGTYLNFGAWGMPVTDSIQFTPYGMSFTTIDSVFDEVIIQISPTSSMILNLNERRTNYEVKEGEITLKKVEPKSRIYLSFLPKYTWIFGWMGILTFSLILVAIAIYKVNDLPKG